MPVVRIGGVIGRTVMLIASVLIYTCVISMVATSFFLFFSSPEPKARR